MQNKTLNSPSDIESDLMQFIGTENYYHRNYPFVYTDGVQYVASKLEAYWLLEAIASHQPEIKKSNIVYRFRIINSGRSKHREIKVF